MVTKTCKIPYVAHIMFLLDNADLDLREVLDISECSPGWSCLLKQPVELACCVLGTVLGIGATA